MRIGVKITKKARDKGVLLRPLGNVIVLMPPLSITLEELDILVEAIEWSIAEITKEIDKEESK
jgi:adenosylmethionine-8-amino-7-oxononanoate aminotransferase